MSLKKSRAPKFSLFLAFLLVIAVAFLYLQQRNSLYSQFKQVAKQLSEHERGQIGALTEAWSGTLEQIRNNPAFRQYISSQIKNNQRSLSRLQPQAEALFNHHSSSAVYSVQYIDANGQRLIHSVNGQVVETGDSVSDEVFFQQVLSQQTAELSKTVFSTTEDSARIYKSLPILVKGKLQGVLTLTIDVRSMLVRYEHLLLTNTLSSLVFLNQQGKVLYKTPGSALSNKEISNVFSAIKQTSAKNAVLEYQRNIWTFVQNKPYNFYILFEQKGSILTADLDSEFIHFGALFGGGIFLLLLAVLSAARFSRSNHQSPEDDVFSEQRSFHFSSISDEIRPPINTLMGALLTISDTKLDARQKGYIDSAKKSADCLLEMVNEFQDYSKINRGELNLEPIDFDLRTTVHDVAELMSAQAYDKGLEISCLVSSDVPKRVVSDATRLRQIMINLIGFAIKYTEHGEISIHISTKEIDQEHHQINIDISDTGNSIDQDTMLENFDLFTQNKNFNERDYDVQGLGLSLSSQIVQIMQGQLTVGENNSGGNTFSLSLPMSTRKRAEAAKPIEKSRIKDVLIGKKVLIVGEVEKNRASLSRALSKWGMSGASMEEFTRVVNVLREAKMSAREFQVCMIDVSLSSSSEKAFELVKEIRQEFVDFELAIVILTTQGNPGDAKRATELSVQAYLTKPLGREYMRNTLYKLFSEPGSHLPTDIVTRHTLKEVDKINTRRVLVAEPSENIQKQIVKYFNAFGVKVDLAESGTKAEAAIRQSNYDMILFDIQLPGMNVFQYTEKFRRNEQTFNDIADKKDHNLPIIGIVKTTDIASIDMCQQSGMDNVVTKPISEDQVKALVEQYWQTDSEVVEAE